MKHVWRLYGTYKRHSPYTSQKCQPVSVYLSLLLHNFSASTELRMKERVWKLRKLWNQLLQVTNNSTFHSPSAAQATQCRMHDNQWIMNWEGSGKQRSGGLNDMFYPEGLSDEPHSGYAVSRQRTEPGTSHVINGANFHGFRCVRLQKAELVYSGPLFPV